MITFEVGGIEYNRNEALHLRAELIELRDEALRQNEFEWSVKLSHLIGLMAMMIDHVWSSQEVESKAESNHRHFA